MLKESIINKIHEDIKENQKLSLNEVVSRGIDRRQSLLESEESLKQDTFLVTVTDPTNLYLDKPVHYKVKANNEEEALKIIQDENLEDNEGDSSELDTYDWAVINLSEKRRKSKIRESIEAIDAQQLPITESEEHSDYSTEIKQIIKKVKEANFLIESAKDSDGDKLEVFDSSSSWEEPCVYEPIKMVNNVIIITYHEPYRKYEPKTETYDLNLVSKDEEKYWMLDECLGTIKSIIKMYKSAVLKQNRKNIKGSVIEEENFDEKLDIEKIENIVFDGVDNSDYPDFVDVFISYASINGRDLTDEELDSINKDGEFVHKKFMESL